MQEIKTLADVQQTPKDEWIVGRSRGGKCPYCGKALPVYRDCCVRYGTCDCEVAQAIEQHNQAILESRNK
jgi:hypothetical protein